MSIKNILSRVFIGYLDIVSTLIFFCYVTKAALRIKYQTSDYTQNNPFYGATEIICYDNTFVVFLNLIAIFLFTMYGVYCLKRIFSANSKYHLSSTLAAIRQSNPSALGIAVVIVMTIILLPVLGMFVLMMLLPGLFPLFDFFYFSGCSSPTSIKFFKSLFLAVAVLTICLILALLHDRNTSEGSPVNLQTGSKRFSWFLFVLMLPAVILLWLTLGQLTRSDLQLNQAYFNPPDKMFISDFTEYTTLEFPTLANVVVTNRLHHDFTGDTRQCLVFSLPREDYLELRDKSHLLPVSRREFKEHKRSCNNKVSEISSTANYELEIENRLTKTNLWARYYLSFSDERSEVYFSLTTL